MTAPASEHKLPVADLLLFGFAFTVMLARYFLYLEGMPLVHLLFVAAKMALVPLAIILVLRTPGKPTVIDLATLAYGATMFAMYLINRTQVGSITLYILDIFIYWALCRWFFARRSLFPLKAMTWILGAFALLNLALMILRPNGLWPSPIGGSMNFLLGGNYNNMGKAFLFMLIANILLLDLLPRTEHHERRIYIILLAVNILVTLGSELMVGSKTSLVGILLLLAFASLLLIPRSRALRFTAVSLLVVIYFALQNWAVFRSMDKTSHEVEFFVEQVLKKDMTFSFRTHVWGRSKLLIERQPITGYGQQEKEWYDYELGVINPHNLILSILVKGGAIALAAFLLLIVVTHLFMLRRYTRIPDDLPGAHVGYILLASIWIYLFMMIFEVFTFSTVSILLTCIGYLYPRRSGTKVLPFCQS